RPVSLNVVAFGPVVAIWAKLEQPTPVQRSILKPSSLVELSVQARLICDDDTAVAVRLLGAPFGGFGAGVVAVALFDGVAESPAPLKAKPRSVYVVLAAVVVSMKAVVLAPAVPNVPNGPPAQAVPSPVQRSTRKPFSLFELSVQARSMRWLLIAV